MGCCHSTPSGEPRGGDVAPTNIHHAIDQAPRPVDGTIDLPNQPLRPPTPLAKSPSNLPQHRAPWTRTVLEHQRDGFFETRIGGDPQVWAAIRRVSELLRQSDLPEAQAVLDAAGLTCPRGKVSRSKGRDGHRGGVYDPNGTLYEVPTWIVVDPSDIIEDGTAKDEGAAGKGIEDDESDDDAIKVEKGKGRASSLGREVKVKCRFSDSTSDRVITFQEREPVSTIVTRLQASHAQGKRVRLMFRGRRLETHSPLLQQNWTEGQVVNAFVDDLE